MANLINLRQRLKVVETIKKTTNAMRLISMSLHSRLRHKKQYLETYKKELFKLMPFVESPARTKNRKELVILVGSQKGLCGTFNTALFGFFKNRHQASHDCIIIGKQMANIAVLNEVTAETLYPELNASNFITIAHQLAETVLAGTYFKVRVISNHPKTFFIQEHTVTEVWPLEVQEQAIDKNEYTLEQTDKELSEYLCSLFIKVHLQEILFSSLLAEQAARFISMDNSTRNAENLLEITKLQYNKLRQATITRELADLTSGLSM